MKKRIFSMLIAVVMVISMLPASVFTAFAEDEWVPGSPARLLMQGNYIDTNTTANDGLGKECYFGPIENGLSVQAIPKYSGSVLNPNAFGHFFYEAGIPTLYLYGAALGKYDAELYPEATNGYAKGRPGFQANYSSKFPLKVVVTKDSSIAAFLQIIDGNNTLTELTIECRNGATLNVDWDGSYVGFNAPKINLVNANIVINQTNAAGTANLFACNELTIDNSTIIAENLGGQFAAADKVIIKNGSNVNAGSNGQVIGVTSKLEVTDSSLTAYRQNGTGTAQAVVSTNTGEIVFTNSTVDIQFINPDNLINDYQKSNAVLISGAGKFTVNSGDVNLMVNSGPKVAALKLGSGALATINGGNVYMGAWCAGNKWDANGGAIIDAGANLVINGGNVTFESSRPAINGAWTYAGGTVTLLAFRWASSQACSELPTFAASEYTVRAGAIGDASLKIVAPEQMITAQTTTSKVTITEGIYAESKVTLPGGVELYTNTDIGAVYAKTDAAGVVSAADSSDWNVKLEIVSGVPTLYLKGATIGNVNNDTGAWSITDVVVFACSVNSKLNIVVLEDSTITAKANTISGITDLTVESVGNAKLNLVTHGTYYGLTATNITLKNANLLMNTNNVQQYGGAISATTLNIIGGDIEIQGRGYQGGTEYTKAAVIATNLNISGGAKVTVNNMSPNRDVCPPAVLANNIVISDDATVVNVSSLANSLTFTESLTINGGTLNVYAQIGKGRGGYDGAIRTKTGNLTVNGGNLNVDKVKNSDTYIHGILFEDAGSFTVNGGTVVANSGSTKDCYGLYMTAGGAATIKGGNVTITGYDYRDRVDADGNPIATNYAMGNGAVKLAGGATFTVDGGSVILRSGTIAMDGCLTYISGTVNLIVHGGSSVQACTVAPDFSKCTGDFNIRAGEIGKTPVATISDPSSLATVQQWASYTISEGIFAEGQVSLPDDVVLHASTITGAAYAKVDAAGKVFAADADDEWNLKLDMVDGVATLYLKGANIGSVSDTGVWSIEKAIITGSGKLNIVVLEDSTFTAKANTTSGITDLTIESVGDAKLTLVTHGTYFGLATTNITLNNANLLMHTNGVQQYGGGISATTLNIIGGNIEVQGAGYQSGTEYSKAAIKATNLNISGGAQVTVTNMDDSRQECPPAILANNMVISDDATVVNLSSVATALSIVDSLTVNGGTLNVHAVVGRGNGRIDGVLRTETGSITVNGGALNVDKAENPVYIHGIWIEGAGSFTVNGGDVTLHTRSAHSRFGLYMPAGAIATINGGNVSINGYDTVLPESDEEGNQINDSSYYMGDGAVYVGEGSSLTVKGGTATFRSGVKPVNGKLTVEGGTVILISHTFENMQFLDTVPTLPENYCISMSNDVALDGSNSVGADIGMLTATQAYTYCRIGEHVVGEEKYEVTKAPTCIASGTASYTVRCDHCAKLYSSEDEVVLPATGVHTPGDVVIENKVDVTLTTPGSYDEVTYCTGCEKEMERNTVIIEALGNGPHFVVESVTAAPGAQNVVVNISIGNNPGLIFAQLEVGYDADKLELVSFTDSLLLNGWLPGDPGMLTWNPVYFTWEDGLALSNNTANGVVVTLVFNVKEGATGTAEITVNCIDENMLNFDLEEVAFAEINGGIVIEDHVHSWNDATCTAPKTCATCGETEGEALGHSWNDATCTAPKTCGTCGATEGEAAGHSYVDTVVPPSTSASGYTLHECSVCGHSYKDKYTSAWAADMVLQDGKLVMTADGNIRATVEIIFIGDNVVTDFTMSTANITSIKNLGKNYVDVNGANGFRNYSGQTPGAEIVLNYEGNYVIRMKYNDTNGVYRDQMKMISVSDLGITTPVISGTVNDQNELVVTNTTGNTSWAISVFYIGNNTVANAYDSYADMMTYGKQFPEVNGTKGYRSYMSLSGIQLTEAGNYVIRIMYVDANGTTQNIAKAISVENGIEIPTITGIDGDHNVIFAGIDAEDVASVNVFYLGDQTVGQPHSDWADMVRIGKNYPNINTRNGYRWYGSMENIQLNAAGNYVVRLNYYDANGVKRMIAKCITVEAANSAPAVSLGNDGHKLVLDVPENINMTSVAVFYLGDENVADPYNMWGQMRVIGRKYPVVNTSAGYRSFRANTNPNYNQLYLNYAGNYVVMLRYTDASGVERILCQYFSIETEAAMPTITIEGNNLVVSNREGFTGMTLFVSYHSGQTVSDAYAEFTRATTIGKYYSGYNTAQGYLKYSAAEMDNCKPLTNSGNYYIYLRYKGADGVQQMIAFVYNHTVVE